MKHTVALSEGEIHSANIRSAKEWIERNKPKVKAHSDKTLLYSGRDYDLENLERDVPAQDRKSFMGTPMYKRIETMRRRSVAERIPVDFQTIEDVLRSIRGHPVIIDKDRIEKHFAHAWECFIELKKLPKLIPSRSVDDCWRRLSEVFASNAVGDIKLLDGCADDYSLLKQDKDFIQKELAALLRNPNLSAAGKQVLLDRMKRYASYFDRRYTDLIRQLDASKKNLRGK